MQVCHLKSNYYFQAPQFASFSPTPIKLLLDEAPPLYDATHTSLRFLFLVALLRTFINDAIKMIDPNYIEASCSHTASALSSYGWNVRVFSSAMFTEDPIETAST